MGSEELLDELAERVANLEQQVEEERERNDRLEERVDELEAENDQLRTELDEEKEQNQRVRASVSRIINDVREYSLEDGSSVDASSPNLVAEAANVGGELYDCIERSRENAGLLNFKTKRPESATVQEKYLNVLGRAEEKVREAGGEVVYLNYREVATHYGCAYNTDGYRVMEEMDERVPGVHYVDGHLANPDVDATTKVEEKSIRVEWNHPDLRGWVRAHREG
ncbi:hypothetical protein [Haladaptatus cibarius]|uniref:hypothetical protein n=1 Tax=Haladaptatus cibarius TaxID=453847 RepID=UPI000B04E732|nr:hypothetical protein [Haladaptatus cibarius]